MGQLTQTFAEIQNAIDQQHDGEQATTVGWDDLKAPATTIRQGATSKPDFDTTNMGLLFPQNDATEIAYIIMQFPHARKAGTDIKPHVHYLQSQATTPTFKIAYRWYDNNDDPTGSFTTVASTGSAFTYSSGDIAQIATFDAIDGSGITGVSSILEVKLYREDNDVAGDILVKEFDVHYQIDQERGSRQEYTK